MMCITRVQGLTVALALVLCSAPLALSQDTEVLTNDGVVKLLSAGLDEQTVIAKINSSPTRFNLDTDSLIKLKEANVPQTIVRAMLNKPGRLVETAVTDPGPALPTAADAPPDSVVARQADKSFPLADKPQSVLFIKSEAGSAKEAVVNVVLGDVGIHLITMGLSPMVGWNPYMGDVINKAAKIGKGILLNKSGDTKGFEVETLQGSTADVTLKEGRAEFLIPLNRFLPSADMDVAALEPVIVRMQPRENEQRRVLSARKVTVTQTKKGRFDTHPTTDRVESNVEQSLIPVKVERMPNAVLRISTEQDLTRGEYALVFRKKDSAGAFTANVPLKATPPPAAAQPAPAPMMFPGMTPEQAAAMQQMQMQQGGQQPPPRRGMFGGLGKKNAAAQNAPAPEGPVSGFLAWDFRVLP